MAEDIGRQVLYLLQATIIYIISSLGSLRIHITGHQLFEVHNHIQNMNLDHGRVNLKRFVALWELNE